MPIVTIKLLKGVFPAQEQEQMMDAVTDAMCEIGGEGMRPAVHVLVEEVEDGKWGIGGTKLRTDEVLERRRKRDGD